MSLAVALWAGSFDIIYHAQDVEFHRERGLHSVASRFGVVAAFRIARAMDVLAVVCLVVLGARMGLSWHFFAACAASSGVLAYKYALASPGDLSRLGMAFGRINAGVSLTMLTGAALAVYLG